MLESQYELYISMIFEKFQILHPANLCNYLSDILKVPLVFSGLFRVVSNLFSCLTKNLHRPESKLVCNKPNRIDIIIWLWKLRVCIRFWKFESQIYLNYPRLICVASCLRDENTGNISILNFSLLWASVWYFPKLIPEVTC